MITCFSPYTLQLVYSFFHSWCLPCLLPDNPWNETSFYLLLPSAQAASYWASDAWSRSTSVHQSSHPPCLGKCSPLWHVSRSPDPTILAHLSVQSVPSCWLLGIEGFIDSLLGALSFGKGEDELLPREWFLLCRNCKSPLVTPRWEGSITVEPAHHY